MYTENAIHETISYDYIDVVDVNSQYGENKVDTFHIQAHTHAHTRTHTTSKKESIV